MGIEGNRFGRGCGNRSIVGFSFPGESEREAEGRGGGLSGLDMLLCLLVVKEDEDGFSLYGPCSFRD